MAGEEGHQHFLADTRQELMTEATASAGHRHPHPGGALGQAVAALPVEPDLHPRQLVSEDFLAFRPDHDCTERPVDGGARYGDRVAVRDALANADKLVVVTCGLIGKVVVAALVLDRHQQELASVRCAAFMVEVLGEFEAVARPHGPAVAAAAEGLGLSFNDLQVATDQRLAAVALAMAVGTEKIVDLVGRDVALFIEAAHLDGQGISRLLVIEGLDGHLARLQAPVAAPLGDRVTGLGDEGAVVADLRLFGQRFQALGAIRDDQAVPVLAVIEVEEQAVLLQQAQHEIQVGFAVLGDVAVGLERPEQVKLELAQPAVVLEHRADDRFDGLLLEDPRINAS